MGWPTYELAQDFFRKPNWLAPKVSPTKTNGTVRPYYRTLVVDNFLRGVRSLLLRSVRSWACFLKSSTSIVWRTSKLGIEKKHLNGMTAVLAKITTAEMHPWNHSFCIHSPAPVLFRSWSAHFSQVSLLSTPGAVAIGLGTRCLGFQQQRSRRQEFTTGCIYIYINVVISKIYIYSNMLFLTGTTLSILMHFVVNLSISTNAFVAFSPTLEALLLSDVQIHRSKGMPCF